MNSKETIERIKELVELAIENDCWGTHCSSLEPISTKRCAECATNKILSLPTVAIIEGDEEGLVTEESILEAVAIWRKEHNGEVITFDEQQKIIKTLQNVHPCGSSFMHNLQIFSQCIN